MKIDGAKLLTERCLVLQPVSICHHGPSFLYYIPFHTERPSKTLVGNIMAELYGLVNQARRRRRESSRGQFSMEL